MEAGFGILFWVAEGSGFTEWFRRPACAFGVLFYSTYFVLFR